MVAVLDHDAFFRDFQRLLLGSQGFRVAAPEDPSEFTAERVISERPLLVITEILLPGRSGLDLVRELKAAPELDGCPVVVFSVLDAEARALAAGADRFVQKPLIRQGYLSVVTEMLNASRARAGEPLSATNAGVE